MVARPSFRQQLDSWLLGLAQGTIQGGAIATKAFFGAAGGSQLASSVHVNLPALSLQQAAMVFVFGAAYHFFDYLSQNRIPGGTLSLAQPTA